MDQQHATISLRDVSKSYGSNLALDQINLEIGPGVTGLLGPNGSGKSTMIKSLLGLLKLQKGQASVLGHRLPGAAGEIRDAVGYVPEDDCFIAGLSGIESVTMLARLSGLPATESLRRGHEVLDFADVGQERYRNVDTYSTGMRQKLKFAQAIVHDPQLLILDEPTTGLDPQQRVSLLAKIRNLTEQHGKTILISTHILTDVKAVCDSVVIMAGGRVHLVDTLENLIRPVRIGVEVWLTISTEQTNADKWIDALQQRELQAEPVAGAGKYWVHGVSADDTQPIWEAAQQAGVLVQRIAAAKNSLEEVFFTAIREAENAAA